MEEDQQRVTHNKYFKEFAALTVSVGRKSALAYFATHANTKRRASSDATAKREIGPPKSRLDFHTDLEGRGSPMGQRCHLPIIALLKQNFQIGPSDTDADIQLKILQGTEALGADVAATSFCCAFWP